MSKTPQFDKALDEYFSGLELDEKGPPSRDGATLRRGEGGQWRTCRFSGNKFYVRPEDIEFYKKVRVPLPTLEPEERRRRRLAAHNSYMLFKNMSAYSGKKIVTIYPPGSPYKIYEPKIWYSTEWDPMEYGQAYDAAQPFFEQFHRLQLVVPRPALMNDPSNINSDYANTSKNLKNCYVTFDQNKGEDLYYHQCCQDDKNCIDCWAIDYSDTCYGCQLSEKLYKCFFCEQSKYCTESFFLWDCRNCDYCFMSSGLRNKKYYFRNQYVGKEKYDELIQEIYLGDYQKLQELLKEFQDLRVQAPRKPFWNDKAINALGDYIIRSRNVYWSLYILESENIAYSEGTGFSREIYDSLSVDHSELCYEVSNIWAEYDYGCKFSLNVDNCRDVEYSDFCINCSNCFGCVGLSNKSFCIFNKQYSEEEYWRRVDELKTAMLAAGEYGVLFPPQYLPFPYLTTILVYWVGFQDYENAKKYGYDMTPVEMSSEDVRGDIVRIHDLPKDIKDVDDAILSKVIFDEPNNKYFQIIRPELEFYRKFGLSLPREHPSIRMANWRKQLDVRLKFYDRQCAQCGKKIQTSYAPERPEIVYCESCYLNELR